MLCKVIESVMSCENSTSIGHVNETFVTKVMIRHGLPLGRPTCNQKCIASEQLAPRSCLPGPRGRERERERCYTCSSHLKAD